jgi:hypothetical protein
MFDDNPKPTIGLETDIWCIGASIFKIVTCGDLASPRELITVSCDRGTHIDEYRTFGAELFDIGWNSDTYSNSLKGLIFACLQCDPDKRPTIKYIQEITREALEVFDTAENQGPQDPKLNKAPLDFDVDTTTALEVAQKVGYPEYRSVASKIRSVFMDLSLGAGGAGAPDPLVVEDDRAEPGKAVWRVHSWKPLPQSPKPKKKMKKKRKPKTPTPQPSPSRSPNDESPASEV